MKAAILAAGRGNRLAAYGNGRPKPIIPILGRPLIEYLVLSLQATGFSEVLVVARDDRVAETCSTIETSIPVSVILRKTQSAFYSFLELREAMGELPFGLFTADTFAPLPAFQRFVTAISESPCDLLLGITDFVQDDRPVRILFDDGFSICEIGKHIQSSRFVATGMHYFSSAIWELVQPALENNISHFRDFLNFLVRSRLKIRVVELGKVLDIDTLENVFEAESMVRALR